MRNWVPAWRKWKHGLAIFKTAVTLQIRSSNSIDKHVVKGREAIQSEMDGEYREWN